MGPSKTDRLMLVLTCTCLPVANRKLFSALNSEIGFPEITPYYNNFYKFIVYKLNTGISDTNLTYLGLFIPPLTRL